MPTISDSSLDMILADLPYGMTSNSWDTVIPLDQLWAHYNRIAKPNAAIVLTAAQPFASALVMSNPRDFKYEWVWQKAQGTGFLNAKRQPLRSHEQVLVFYRKQCTYNPQMTAGKPYTCVSSTPSINYRLGTEHCLTINNGDRYPTTVLKFKYETGEKHHPTQKPTALLRYLILTYTDEGQTVIDNCMGSGSTGVACMQTGRNFVGIEKETDYYEIAAQRINEAHQREEPLIPQPISVASGIAVNQLCLDFEECRPFST